MKTARRSIMLLSLGPLLGCSSLGRTARETVGRYPDYNSQPLPPDSTGMGETALQVSRKLGLGLNIGNSLEATPGRSEMAWGNPQITRTFIQFVKASGFDAVRLPVSWDQYADPATARIDAAWMSRVKEVVQDCLEAGLYVLVNIHWDGGWLENHVTPDKQAINIAKQKAYWQQIATALREIDGRLMFAGANEPHVKSVEQMAVLMSYHQAFIDAVRATGGRNVHRVLVVQGPSTDIELTNRLMIDWPRDTVAGRLMAEVHYYTPWNFTGLDKDESWGQRFFYWGQALHSATDSARNATWGEEDTVDQHFGLMKTRFVDKGIPVVIGEFGAMQRSELTGDALRLHLASRAHYLQYVATKARALGLNPFFWDTGGLLDRWTNTVRDPQALAALMASRRP
jgi:aryl-phospho-beta-D-glucosidase BglC (GH1 family)